jgi:hypothetical protein
MDVKEVWLSLAQDMPQMCEDGNESSATLKDRKCSVCKQLSASQEGPYSIEIVISSDPFI